MVVWSFVKIAVFVAVVAALTLGAGYLMETGGGLRLSVANWEFTLRPVQAIVATVLLFIAFWLVMLLAGFVVALLRFLNGDETAISRYFDRNRERKGFQALADGMMAVASGEGRLAMSKAAKAEKLLARPELTNLLSAQAAELSGDTKAATEVYKRLLVDDRTRFVGVRGLLKQKITEGDTETALRLAEKAFAMRPRHQEVQDTLLKLQAESGDWSGARKVLGTKLKQGLLPRDVHRRRDAVMALQQARGVIDSNASIESREAAIAANKASPDLIPAAVMAAEGYAADNKLKYAERVLKKAWEANPHPDLARAFANLVPDETPAGRLKRFDALLRLRSADPETRMLLAELNIAAEDFPAARRALGDLADTNPTTRSVTLMAAIERGEGGDDAAVRGWLARALTVSRGPQWICDSCQHVHDEWTPICASCGGFDTLTWRVPQHDTSAMTKGAEMLPLIVGSSSAHAAETVRDDREITADD